MHSFEDVEAKYAGGYPEALREVAGRYFNIWTEQRDAILESAKINQQQTLAAFGFSDMQEVEAWIKDHTDSTVEEADRKLKARRVSGFTFRGEEEGYSPSLSLTGLWFERREELGGILGQHLVFPTISVATPREVLGLRQASDDELRGRPPVAIVSTVVVPRGKRRSKVDTSEFSPYVLGRQHPVDLEGAPESIRSLFAELIAQINTVLEQPVSVGIEGPAIRGAYRAFTLLFWDWYVQQRSAESVRLLKTSQPMRQVPEIAPLGDNVHAQTDLLVQSIFGLAISAAEGGDDIRISPRHGFPEFEFKQNQGTVNIAVRPEGSPDYADAVLAKTLYDQVISRMDERDFDTWIIMYANWSENRDQNGGAWISRKAILASRGLEPKKRKLGAKVYSVGHRDPALTTAGDSVQRLSALEFSFRGVSVPDARGKKSPSLAFESRAFSVTDWIRQDSIDPGASTVEAWYYQPGLWVRNLASDSQFTSVQRTILKLDPYHDRWTKRLAWYVAIHLRINRGPFERKIGTLVRELRLRSDKNPQRDREFLDKALKALVHAGHIGSYEIEGFDEATLPARGATAIWEKATIRFTPSPQAVTALKTIATRAQEHRESRNVEVRKPKKKRGPRSSPR